MSEKLPYATQMLQETTELLRILRTQHADIERKDALLRQALDALEKSRPLAYHFDAWEEALRALNKELSALPPLPSPKWLDTHQGPQRAFTADQMQAYAQQARASLESKNKRLREMLQGVLMMGRGTSGRIIIEGWQEDVIRAALKEQP